MRDKLIELICEELQSDNCIAHCNYPPCYGVKFIADHLISHGVTFADVPDTNVGKWIPVSERLPEPFVSVLVHMPGEKPFPTVREGYIAGDGLWYAGYYTREPGEVTHWMPMIEPPKEGE